MRRLIVLVVFFALLSISSVYATWTEYEEAQYLDLNGDFVNEIIIKSHHGAGSGHYVEMMRIFKEDDESAGLRLIFIIITLDSVFGYGPGNDDIAEVEFSEPDIDTGARDIIVKSKKVYYKDDVNEIIDKEEDLGIKVFKWDGNKFVLHMGNS